MCDMGCKMIAAITWTQLELKALLEDEESGVYFERAKRHLGLHPFHLTDLNAALREILNSTVNSYDTKINGIILSYKNPKLLSPVGTVLYDACYIHVDVEADFYVFRPNVGDTLKGIVNKKSQDHVGILVHKTFNVSIPRPNEDVNWIGHSIQIGQEVRFTVTCLEFKGRLPYIRGSIDARDYLRGCKLFDESFEDTKNVKLKPKITKFLLNDDGDYDGVCKETTVDNVDYSIEGSDVEKKVVRKKTKKLKRESSEDEVSVKSRKKQKVKADVTFLEDEDDSYVANQSHNGDDSDIEGGFSSMKLEKFKSENSEDKIKATKPKRSKVKIEKVMTKAEIEVFEKTERHVEEIIENIIKGEFSPDEFEDLNKVNTEKKINLKSKSKAKVEVKAIDLYADITEENTEKKNNLKSKPKAKSDVKVIDSDTDIAKENTEKKNNLKRKTKAKSDVKVIDSDTDIAKENTEKKNNLKRKTKTKAEVEMIDSDTDIDEPKMNGNRNTKNESSSERRRQKHKVKVEVSSDSETESDVNKSKRSKQIKTESNDKKSRKSNKVKAEVFSSAMESGSNETKQSVKTKNQSTDEKSKKKHRIKAEVLSPKTYD